MVPEPLVSSCSPGRRGQRKHVFSVLMLAIQRSQCGRPGEAEPLRRYTQLVGGCPCGSPGMPPSQ